MRFSYDDVVGRVLADGIRSAPRGVATGEVVGATVVLPPEIVRVRRARSTVRLGWLEGLMVFGGIFDTGLIRAVAPNARLDLYAKQSDYGPRIHRQLLRAGELLGWDPDTRRAVVYLNNRMEPLDDLACATSVQFLLRGGVLETVVCVRSWDLVLGFVTDVVVFGFLHQAFAFALGAGVGRLTVQAGSLHVYDETVGLAHEIGNPVLHTLVGDGFSGSVEDVSANCRDMAREYASTGVLPFSTHWETVPDRRVFGFLVP